jgi:serine/threonine protein kinase
MSVGLPERYAVVESVGADSRFESFKIIDQADGSGKLLHTASVEFGKTATLTRMAASLPERTSHDRVCVVLDTGCGKTQSILWLVTEYLAGAASLADLLTNTTFDVADALNIGADVASGLNYLTAHEILYSDLTPSDVLVCHQPGRGVRAKIDRPWVPYLSSELAAYQNGREDAHVESTLPGATAAAAFCRVWRALSARTRTDVADETQADAFHRANEVTHKAADITAIAALFVRLVRTNVGPQLVPAETASDPDIDAVLSLDEETLEREYKAATRSDLPATHIVREIASRVFVHNTGTFSDVLRSAMNASADERMPEQLSLLDVGEEPSAGPRLLLVDADEDRCSRYSRFFQTEGFFVESVSSPIKAVDLLHENTFDAAAVWLSSSDATQDGAVRELLRCNNILPVLSVFASTDAADVLRVLGRITRIEVHRRYRKRAGRADLVSAELPFYGTQRSLEG